MHCCGSPPAQPSPGRQPSVGQPQPIGERICCCGQVGQQSAQRPQLGPASPASPVPRTYRGRSPARINVAIPIPNTTANTANFVFMDRSSFLLSLCFTEQHLGGRERSPPPSHGWCEQTLHSLLLSSDRTNGTIQSFVTTSQSCKFLCIGRQIARNRAL